MTIEKSPPSTEAKPAAKTDARSATSAKGKSDKPEGGEAGGFMAILATLDSESGPAAAADTSCEACIGPTDAFQAPQIAAPVDISYAQTAMDAAALLAQAAQLVPATEGLPASARDMSASQLAAANANPQALGSVTRPAKNPFDATTTLPQPGGVLADGAPQAVRKPPKAPVDLGGAMGQLSSASQASSNSAALSAQVDARVDQLALKTQSMAAAVELPPALLSAVANASRREDDGRERSVFKSAASELGPVATPASAPAGPTTLTMASPTAASPTDLYVAEQVKYWISNDVKNAEMKLDGIGNNPVEVSINMQGNEAHVAFRSDESQARDVLEAASSHLKDLLQREGLVLTGVSVGTTGAGNSGSQERREQQGARHARAIAATQSAAEHKGVGSTRASGRALDLFV